jgi:8-oxo-dGTP pyrophosphatase MutT (NUDIX family)
VGKSKARKHVQLAALPFSFGDDGRPHVMLLTSRETRRWVIPKGWPMRGHKPTEVAAREAFEEAGLLGTIVGKRPVGRYHYEKQLSSHHSILCEVRVYMFLVKRQLDDWPEKTERETQWFEPSVACELVHEGGLAEILRRTIGTPESVISPVASKCFGPNLRKIR